RLGRLVRARRGARAHQAHEAQCRRRRARVARNRRGHRHLHERPGRRRGDRRMIHYLPDKMDGESRSRDDLTPKQIVSELDKHIVGQANAKRAVAIALRNRWRRMQIENPLRQELTPKNILMIGPTGCAKTEIARRLAKLANAPFVKVEATKFTEVGYVGRDV